MRGHALEHGASRVAVANVLRDRHQRGGWRSHIFGVRPESAAPGDAVADLGCFHVSAHRGDYARTFLPNHEWHGRVVAPLADVDIDEVNARGGNLDQRLVTFRLRDGQVHQL